MLMDNISQFSAGYLSKLVWCCTSMAVLNVRNLPEEIHAKLRVRAAKAGRSMEAEARAILTAVILKNQPPISHTDLQKWVTQLYGDYKPNQVVETLIAERRQEAAGEFVSE